MFCFSGDVNISAGGGLPRRRGLKNVDVHDRKTIFRQTLQILILFLNFPKMGLFNTKFCILENYFFSTEKRTFCQFSDSSKFKKEQFSYGPHLPLPTMMMMMMMKDKLTLAWR